MSYNPLTIDFGSALLCEAGANIQAGGGVSTPFTAKIEVLDSSSTVLATFLEAGFSTGASDGSAIFIGVAATGGDTFSQVRFSLTESDFGGHIGDYAINQVDFSVCGNQVVPEPSSIALLGGGVILLGLAARRRRSR